ncbi:MAG TPA: hypothetical protein VFM56_01395 [Solimonas sp.]|nr:hypothetical protein [Solimonas sp.]
MRQLGHFVSSVKIAANGQCVRGAGGRTIRAASMYSADINNSSDHYQLQHGIYACGDDHFKRLCRRCGFFTKGLKNPTVIAGSQKRRSNPAALYASGASDRHGRYAISR